MTSFALARPMRRLAADTSGVALIEFAFVLPILVLMSLTGAELTNYITVKMRISQIALSIADNAARMGNGTALAAKTIDESDINDLFAGAQLEAGGLNLQANGRVTLSDLEPTAAGATTYKIKWQRCFGNKSHASTYGTYNAGSGTNMPGMGPAGRLVTAQPDNATMFVEVYYVYKPLLNGSWAPTTTLMEIASMAVRDRRDLSSDASAANPTHPQGIYNKANVTASTC
jgi:Flp pilus assembly protein TadG